MDVGVFQVGFVAVSFMFPHILIRMKDIEPNAFYVLVCFCLSVVTVIAFRGEGFLLVIALPLIVAVSFLVSLRKKWLRVGQRN